MDLIRLLVENYENNKFYIYHCAKKPSGENKVSGYKGILRFGFESFFNNTNTGNMYGRGIYATTDLQSSINNSGGSYGSIIIKAELFSLDRYLIWDREIAKVHYGDNWEMKDQLRLLLPESVIEEMKTINSRNSNMNLYDFCCNPPHLNHTSNCAADIYTSRSSFKGASVYDLVHGFIFLGGNDGRVIVVKDFKNAIPVAYSLDIGKTWDDWNSKVTDKYTKNDFDSEYHFGKKYKKVEVPFFGMAKVTNNEDKINYINKDGEEVSETWFDGGGTFDEVTPDYPMAAVLYKDHSFFLSKDGQIYEAVDDEYPLCDSSELPNML